jgi:hypothetical protein
VSSTAAASVSVSAEAGSAEMVRLMIPNANPVGVPTYEVTLVTGLDKYGTLKFRYAKGATLVFPELEYEKPREDYTLRGWFCNKKLVTYNTSVVVDRDMTLLTRWMYTSPLVIDLDGDGVETTAIDAGIYFDYNSDGFFTQTAWAGGDDGLLVRDINGNGQIDNGTELFGEHTILQDGSLAGNGFRALAEFDKNLDKRIDIQEAASMGLMIWRDANVNGYVDPGEMLSPNDLGIEYFSLDYEVSDFYDGNANHHKLIGSYVREDGNACALTDVWFITNS